MRSMSRTGNARWGVIAVVVVVLGLVLSIGSCYFSEEARIERVIDAARDDLAEGRGPEFLAHFADDVRYQGSQGRAELERDLARWQSAGRLRLYLRETRIEVDEGGADVELEVLVGLSLLQTAPVQVRMRVDRSGDGPYRVTRFDWARR